MGVFLDLPLELLDAGLFFGEKSLLLSKLCNQQGDFLCHPVEERLKPMNLGEKGLGGGFPEGHETGDPGNLQKRGGRLLLRDQGLSCCLGVIQGSGSSIDGGAESCVPLSSRKSRPVSSGGRRKRSPGFFYVPKGVLSYQNTNDLTFSMRLSKVFMSIDSHSNC